MPGSSIIFSASAGVAIIADRSATAPRNFTLVIGLLLQSTPCIRAGRQRTRLTFAHGHSRRVQKSRSRFGDQDFTMCGGPAMAAADEKVSSVIAGLDPASHLFARNDGYAAQARV